MTTTRWIALLVLLGIGTISSYGGMVHMVGPGYGWTTIDSAVDEWLGTWSSIGMVVFLVWGAAWLLLLGVLKFVRFAQDAQL